MIARFYTPRTHAAGVIRAWGPASDRIVGQRDETRADYLIISIGQTFYARTEYLTPTQARRLRDTLDQYLSAIEAQ